MTDATLSTPRNRWFNVAYLLCLILVVASILLESWSGSSPGQYRISWTSGLFQTAVFVFFATQALKQRQLGSGK